MKHVVCKPPAPQAKPLSVGQLNASVAKHNKTARKLSKQIGYVAGANIGN